MLDLLQQTKEALAKAISKKKLSQEMLRNLGPAIVQSLTPILQEIASNSKLTKEDILNVISNIKIDLPEINVPASSVKVDAPEVKIPEIKIPEIIVPKSEISTTNIEKVLKDGLNKFKAPKPEIKITSPKIPDLAWPKSKMPICGAVSLEGINLQNPLPVQLRDSDGKPMNFPEVMNISSGGGGGRIAKEKKPENVHIYNIDILTANTEYSQELPANTIAFTIQNREDNDLRLSYYISKVADSSAGFITVKGGQTYYENNLSLSKKTIYVASERTGVAEIVSYD